MKVAFFDAATGAPVRLFSGKPEDAQAVLADPRFADCVSRTLDGGALEGAVSLYALSELMIGLALSGAQSLDLPAAPAAAPTAGA